MSDWVIERVDARRSYGNGMDAFVTFEDGFGASWTVWDGDRIIAEGEYADSVAAAQAECDDAVAERRGG